MTAAEHGTDPGNSIGDRAGSGAELTLRRFRTGDASGPLTEEVKAWLVAHEIGFQLPPGSAAKHEALAQSRLADEAEFTGVYDEQNLYGANIPVATYISYRRTLNAGRELLPAHLITGVGVRAEYQGRGILRRVISEDLARVQRDGVPIAALTATEGGIYSRFGFGVSTFQKSVEVDARTARFRNGHGATGTVQQIDRATYDRVAADVFDCFHGATTGSIGRATLTPRGIAGEFGFDRADLNPNPNRRFAAHIAASSGEMDGYVAYQHRGWHGGPRVIEAVDIVAETRAGYLALWEYLLRQSLTDVIRFEHAPAADVLPWALVDPRAYRVVTENDLLWLRILDVERALAARDWLVDGDVTFQVQDALGLIDGDYHLETRSGKAKVTRGASKEVDATIDASALASLYLGGVSVQQLLGTGLVQAASPETVETLQRLFTTSTTPYTNTIF